MIHPNLTRLKQQADVAIEAFLQQWPRAAGDGLYEPVHYLMELGGKRLRAVLALSAAEAEGRPCEVAFPVALGVELFHNFTLMHDDIMDAAPLRRGKETVHMKWDENAAILSGDAMYTLAHIAFAKLPSNGLPAALQLFNRTALEVCLGQQSDMAFETRNDVTVAEYMEMIRLKTSVLVAASLALGAIAAGASEERVDLWYALGEELGLAFQMQDDLLDAFGDTQVGKQIGGDILADKKTFLRLYTQEQGGDAAREVLTKWDGQRDDAPAKIEAVRKAMSAAGAAQAARELMHAHVAKAMASAEALELKGSHLEWFQFLGGMVTQRTS
ncbi:MAG: polyprenyl synthetase [Flavobacteriales bacterium]|nr:polyprenyl synthetase [Flavobacteriales bacterium]|tara:strand:+ start:271 stop:1254 length:984 start_codon:yes stop_codon:yes gene_type:complete